MMKIGNLRGLPAAMLPSTDGDAPRGSGSPRETFQRIVCHCGHTFSWNLGWDWSRSSNLSRRLRDHRVQDLDFQAQSVTNSPAASTTAAPAGAARNGSWRVGLAVAWLSVFLVAFYQFDLPNNPQISRVMIWEQVPSIFMELVDPIETRGAIDTSWAYLPQRFNILAPAVLVLASAWAVGCLILRLFPVALLGVEQLVVASGLGLSGLSLLTLICGVLGRLSSGPLIGCLLVLLLLELGLRFRSRSRRTLGQPVSGGRSPHHRWLVGCAIAAAPFLLAILLGSMLPPVDFDVREYHLQGPKEFFQSGRIQMLEHNVYTSFPFLTEMLSLLSMVICDDWFRGALVGKAVLAAFAPLTALCVFAVARRWAGDAAAAMAALIHISTPWTYRISVIAYAEGGLTFYLAASFLMMVRLVSDDDRPRSLLASSLLLGLLAGSAMACKYPGAVSVVIPALAVVVWVGWHRTDLQDRTTAGRGWTTMGLWFLLGVLCTVGPWLIKNTVETGNPVYPLLYSVFGGADWNDAMNQKWRAAHSPDNYQLTDLGNKLIDVTLKSDWLSPLLFALAPLALACRRIRRATGCGWLYVGYLFLGWWVLTHRIDRFWLPMIPIVAVLAGCGATWTTSQIWKSAMVAGVSLAVVFNLAFVTTVYCGYNAYLADGEAAKLAVQKPGLRYLNQRLPAGARVLCVGEAEVFDAEFELVYDTVFDTSIFQTWFERQDASAPDGASPQLRSDAQIRQILASQRITHVYVNWADILRYRTTYGYTPFVTPRVFQVLQQRGMLAEEQTLGWLDYARMSPAEQSQVRQWGQALVRDESSPTAVAGAQLFTVPVAVPDQESSSATDSHPE